MEPLYAQVALECLDVHEASLDKMDCRILHTTAVTFWSGPARLERLADAFEETYEFFIIQQGFLRRTPRG